MQAAAQEDGVERFLDTLVLDGFSIGVRESLKAHQLAGILAAKGQALKENAAARAMFTALVARDPAEQRRVAELYDRSIGGIELPPPPPQPVKSIAPPRDPDSLGHVMAAIAVLALLVILAVWMLRQPEIKKDVVVPPPPVETGTDTVEKPDTPPVPAPPAPGQWTTDALYADLDRLMRELKLSAAPTLRELHKAGWPPKEATGAVQLHLPALVGRLRLPPDWPIDLNAEDVRRKIMAAFADFGVQGILPQYAFTSPEVGTLNQFMAGIAANTPELTYTDFIDRSQFARIELVRQIAKGTKFSVPESVSPDLVDRALAIEIVKRKVLGSLFADASWVPPMPSAVTTAPAWLRPAAMVLPFAILALWFLGLASRRRAFIKRSADASSPLDHRFVIEAPEDIRVNRTDKAYLSRVAASLNVRQTVAALTIDPERSIKASVAAGGLFTPVRGRITSTPAYLLLIEAKSAADHETRRLEMLYRRLADAGVAVKRLFYFDSPAWLHEDFGAGPRPIEDIAAHYEDRRLIVLGEGRGFLAPLTLTAEPWAHVLTVWPQRAMLTPRPLEEWGAQEFSIARELGLPLGRATVEGLFALAELLGLDEGRDRPLFRAYGFSGGFDLKPLPALIRSRPYYWLSENHPGEIDAKRLDTVLRYYLDAEGLMWLKALAVYPALQWDLTLYLGRDLDLYQEPRLAALTLLPWLREGHMPQWLRRRLIATLPDDIRVRTIAAIHKIMLAEAAPSSARLETMRGDPLRRPSLRAREPSRDGLFVETLANEGDFPAPDWLKPSLKSWFATLAWKDFGAVALACLYAAAAWWLTPTPEDGALGPGAFMPLTMLIVLPALGWLALAWYENRLHVPAWLAEAWAEASKPEPKQDETSFREDFAKLGANLKALWQSLKERALEKAAEGRKEAQTWLARLSGQKEEPAPLTAEAAAASGTSDAPKEKAAPLTAEATAASDTAKADAPTNQTVRRGIYISYSHKDRNWAERVNAAIKPLVHGENIPFLDNRSIEPGSDWSDQIGKAIATARVAVLLVSHDFLASDFIQREELPQLLKQRDQGLRIFWILIEPALYQQTPLNNIQAAWDPSRPLAALDEGEREEALREIAIKLADWTAPQKG